MKHILIIFIGLTLISCTGKKEPELSQNEIRMKASQKAGAFFRVQMVSKDTGQGDIQIMASVFPEASMDEAQILWKLPKHVDLTGGELESTMQFTNREPHHSVIRVNKAQLKEKDQIFFFAFKMVNGERMGGTGVYVHGESSGDVDASSANQKSKPAKKKPRFFQ